MNQLPIHFNDSSSGLVCTDVLEEGIDITQCNLVIRFDEIVVFRSWVQSKGRARFVTFYFTMYFIFLITKLFFRAKPSKFIVMVEETNYSSWYVNEQDFRQMETMQIDKVHDGPETGFDDDEIDDEEPYFANPDDKVNSPRITGITAISIVRRIAYFDLKTLGTYVCTYFFCFRLANIVKHCHLIGSRNYCHFLN